MLTVVGLIGFGIFLGADVLLAINRHPADTWSEHWRAWGRKCLAPAFITGVLVGHFFHPAAWPRLLGSTVGGVLLIAMCLLLTVMQRSIFKIPIWFPLIPGFFAGAVLWPV